VHRVLKEGGFAISLYGWTAVDRFMAAWRKVGLRPVGHIVFRKHYASSTRSLRYEHEQPSSSRKVGRACPRTPSRT
jgi:DNA modification methylase